MRRSGWIFAETQFSAIPQIQVEPRVSRSEAASSKRLVRMVPGSARNWVAVNSKIQRQKYKKMNTKTKFFSAVIIPCLVAWFSQSAIAQSGTWTATGNLNTVRQSHTATLLPNGMVLVAGGFDSSSDLAGAGVDHAARRTSTAT